MKRSNFRWLAFAPSVKSRSRLESYGLIVLATLKPSVSN